MVAGCRDFPLQPCLTGEVRGARCQRGWCGRRRSRATAPIYTALGAEPQSLYWESFNKGIDSMGQIRFAS